MSYRYFLFSFCEGHFQWLFLYKKKEDGEVALYLLVLSKQFKINTLGFLRKTSSLRLLWVGP